MIVVITSTGGVTKRVLAFDAPVDGGLVAWAVEFLNEQLAGVGLGARKLHARLAEPALSPTERTFLDRLTPAFTNLAATAEDSLYVDGAVAAAVASTRFQDVAQINALMEMLEGRVTLLEMLRMALDERDVVVRIGAENEVAGAALAGARGGRLRPAAAPAGHRLADRSGGDGLRDDDRRRARGRRPAVALRRRRVRRVSQARLLRGARRRPRRRRGRHQEGVSQARPRAASRRQRPRPAGRGEVQGGRRGLRDPLRRRAPPGLRPLRPRRPAARRPERPTSRASARSPTSSTRSSAAAASAAAFGGSGPRRAATSRSRVESTSRRPSRGRRVDVAYEAVDRCERCHGNGAEPGTPIETCERCGGNGVLQAVSRTPFGQVVRTGRLRRLRRRRQRRREAAATRCDGRGREVRQRTLQVDVPAGIADGQRIRAHRPRPRRRARRPARRPLRARRARASDERFIRDGDDLVTVVDVPAAGRRARRQARASPTLDGSERRRHPAGHAARRDLSTLRGHGHAAAAPPGPPRRPARRSSTSSSRASSTREQRELLAAAWPRRSTDDEPTTVRGVVFAKLKRACSGERAVIRLAIRVARADAEIALAELLELAPAGVEEVDRGDSVEYAIYGAPGELPELPALRAAAGGALVERHVERGRRRLGRALARVPPAGDDRRAPATCARRGPRRPIAAPGCSTSSSTPARRSAPARTDTTRLCLELLLELAPGGALVDLGCGSGVLAIAAAKLGWGPVAGVRPRARGRRRRAARTPRPTAWRSTRAQLDLLPRRAARAGRADGDGEPAAPAAAARRARPASPASRRARSSPAACCAPRPTRSPPRSPTATDCASAPAASAASGPR